MNDFKDRVPVTPNQYKMTDSESNESYVVLERADGATEEGTPLNRSAFMALQGFENATISLTTGSSTITIDGTYDSGTAVTSIQFGSTIQFSTTFTASGGAEITENTTFNPSTLQFTKEVS